MGYYVTLTESNAILPANNLNDAYQAMCALNQRNDLKHGGTWPRVEQDGPHDGIWFSWMDWNYPETCADAAAIFTQLGFDFVTNEDGSIQFFRYENKIGAEEHFLAAIAPYLVSSDNKSPQFVWQGEDGAIWRQIVVDGEMVTQNGTITFA